MALSRLRLRLTGGFAVAFFVGFAALDGLNYSYVTFNNQHEFRERLKDAAASSRDVIRREGGRIHVDNQVFDGLQRAMIDYAPSKLAFVVYDSAGHRIASGGDAAMIDRLPGVDSLPAVGDIDRIPLPSGFHLELATDTVLGTHVVAAATTEVRRARQIRLIKRILLTIPVSLLLALTIGYYLSRWSLAPIDALARATDAITPGPLAERLPVRSPPDELDRLTARFNGLLDRIQALQAQSDAFLREVAHQIRTPLTLVLGETELGLERERSAEEYVRTLRRVHAAASQMTHRVRDLLLLARMEAGERPPLRDAVELDSLALEATDLFRARASAFGQHLELREIVACEVAGDEALLREAVLEMLENACRHGEPGSPVAVSVRPDGANVLLEVRNAGEPITPRPAPAADGTGREGTRGLGLSIMRWIASSHGGELVIRRTGRENIVALVFPAGNVPAIDRKPV
ncbi:MAG TPA: histidine kinase dimerization/phospho-acceptor domain-containing protein [Gemmatimonadales bacterium]|jgi:signal transduction histidine kinase|nr:histidine kinase dimerization/phospho-acceptor domain-containing protein [Gemmatimonadales bacterium]